VIKPAPLLVRWYLRASGFAGITLPPFGIFILSERINDQRLRLHEECHWRQYQRMGFVGFYLRYFWNTLRHGYWNNPMEIEARKAENEHS
jgi:hypothetical protein